MRHLFLWIAIVLGASACGQKGPLYLRENPPAGYKPPRSETYKPVPYPKDIVPESERDGGGK